MKKKELKIDLGIFGRTVIGQVVEMDDSERGKYTLLYLQDNVIVKELLSEGYPYLGSELLVRGIHTNLDKKEFIRTYKTEEEAQQAYEDILRLVDEYNKQLNKPKFEESEEYQQQIKINELLMDMRKWQYENDDPVNIKEKGKLYCIIYDIDSIEEIFTDYFYCLRQIGAVHFSSKAKAEECKEVFKNRIKSIYRNGGND